VVLDVDTLEALNGAALALQAGVCVGALARPRDPRASDAGGGGPWPSSGAPQKIAKRFAAESRQQASPSELLGTPSSVTFDPLRADLLHMTFLFFGESLRGIPALELRSLHAAVQASPSRVRSCQSTSAWFLKDGALGCRVRSARGR